MYIYKDRFVIELQDCERNLSSQEIIFQNLKFPLGKQIQLNKQGINPLRLEIACPFEFNIDQKVIKSKKQSRVLWLNDYFETICANCGNVIIPFTQCVY